MYVFRCAPHKCGSHLSPCNTITVPMIVFPLLYLLFPGLNSFHNQNPTPLHSFGPLKTLYLKSTLCTLASEPLANRSHPTCPALVFIVTSYKWYALGRPVAPVAPARAMLVPSALLSRVILLACGEFLHSICLSTSYPSGKRTYSCVRLLLVTVVYSDFMLGSCGG